MIDIQLLDKLVQEKISLIKQRWGSKLASDQKLTIIRCLESLRTSCPADHISITKRKILIQNVYDLLIQRVVTGFKFDQAPSALSNRLSYLTFNHHKSINNNSLFSDGGGHLIIGENYYILQNLISAGYREKINIIYIDPPYNTKEIQSYKDKFRRCGWLSMMKERLELAYKLLSPSGVIFVSIDDSEQAYLKVLMDQVFEESNFVTNFVYVSNVKGRQTTKNIATTLEYILLYQKKDSRVSEVSKEYLQKLMPKIYSRNDYQIFNDKYGEYVIKNELKQTNITKFGVHARPNLRYPIFVNKKNTNIIKTQINKNLEKELWYEIWPSPSSASWRWGRSKVEKEFDKLWFNLKNMKIYTKNYNFRKSKIKNIIFSSEITTKGGTDQLKSLNINFNYPKNINLLKFLLKPFSKNALILDFFAGSGTTAHAVLELNRQDGGKRKFILCTNNENGIGDICYDRIHRITTGRSSKGETNFLWLNSHQPYNKRVLLYNLKTAKCGLNSDINIKEDRCDFNLKKIIKEIDETYKKLNPNFVSPQLDEWIQILLQLTINSCADNKE